MDKTRLRSKSDLASCYTYIHTYRDTETHKHMNRTHNNTDGNLNNFDGFFFLYLSLQYSEKTETENSIKLI